MRKPPADAGLRFQRNQTRKDQLDLPSCFTASIAGYFQFCAMKVKAAVALLDL